MASAYDVAKYILRQSGSMDTWKLQKLVYYSVAWHKVWEEKDLFTERVEAWANGPVVPELYRSHRGNFQVRENELARGAVSNLKKSECDSIDVVLEHYGKYKGWQLRELTHREPPWRDARRGLPPGAPSNNVITTDAMAAYYGSL